MMKKSILSLLSMAIFCAMTFSSCDKLMSAIDNPVGSYVQVKDTLLTLYPGEVGYVKATTISTEKIIYTSSNEKVAMVDPNGFVTAISGGEAVITVSVEANEYYQAGSASYKVKVITDLSSLTAPYVAQDGDILTGTTDYQIGIADGATVYLSKVSITDNNLVCYGDATIVLVDESENTLSCGCTPLLVGPTGKTLTIKGNGRLNATTTGFDCAAIGSPEGKSCGNIVIESGVINASSVCAAAIGSGNQGGQCGDITIQGGTVTAVSTHSYGAGIGSGDSYGGGSTCGNITITGGTVTAKGSDCAAGIGAGGCEANTNTSCGHITITGGHVTATGGKYAAGIGTGVKYFATYTASPSCGDITLSGGTIVATKGEDATYDVGPGDVQSTPNVRMGHVGTVSVSVAVKDAHGNAATIYP